MSYSFAIDAASKDEVETKVESEFVQVVSNQPWHAADKQAAQDAVRAFVAVLRTPVEGERIGVTVSGSLNWQMQAKAGEYTGVHIQISAFIAPAK